MADMVDFKRSELGEGGWLHDHSRKPRDDPRQTESPNPRACYRRSPIKCVMLVISDAQSFGSDIGHVAYRAACGKLGDDDDQFSNIGLVVKHLAKPKLDLDC